MAPVKVTDIKKKITSILNYKELDLLLSYGSQDLWYEDLFSVFIRVLLSLLLYFLRLNRERDWNKKVSFDSDIF